MNYCGTRGCEWCIGFFMGMAFVCGGYAWKPRYKV